MNICIIGTGYVGLVTGACFAQLGHRVVCVDQHQEKIEGLKKGQVPFYERGLEKLVHTNLAVDRLRFETELAPAVADSQVIFIAVGTPEGAQGVADVSQVMEAAFSIGRAINEYKIIVTKSTVPVGTSKRVEHVIQNSMIRAIPFAVVSNPEFLREGSAIDDFFHMERVVIGTDDSQAARTVQTLYEEVTVHILHTDCASAEMIKYASNAFLATKVTFINQIANICERVGADVCQVSQGMGLDSRIGTAFLQAGVGYGGSCFPKDTKALIGLAHQVGYDFTILEEVIKANEQQHLRVVDKLLDIFGCLKGRTIAILGAAFKPNTDDTRSAPSRYVGRKLQQQGASIKIYDPMADALKNDSFFRQFPLSSDLYGVLKDCDGALVLTEWEEVQKMDLGRLKECLKHPVLVDGRNIFSLQQIRNQGLIYCSMGRPTV